MVLKTMQIFKWKSKTLILIYIYFFNFIFLVLKVIQNNYFSKILYKTIKLTCLMLKKLVRNQLNGSPRFFKITSNFFFLMCLDKRFIGG